MNARNGRFGAFGVGLVVGVLFLLVSTGSVCAQVVTYPSATGVIWHQGESQTITWSGITGSWVKIELLRGGSRKGTLSRMAPNNGVFTWHIPANQKTSSDYRIRIIGTSKPHGTAVSSSPFTIIPPVVTVVSPNGGEVFYRGSTYQIDWTTSNTGGSVRIYLYQGNRRKRLIAIAAPNTGAYSWKVPRTVKPGANYRVRILSTTNLQQEDFSDGPFSIEHPALRVTYPNDSTVTWNRGGLYSITWDNDGEPGTAVKIDLYKGRSRRWCIVNSTLNSGVFPWVVPVGIGEGNDYRIKVTSINHPRYFDYSDQYFSISEVLAEPSIAVVDPDGDPTSADPGECGNTEVAFSDTVLPDPGVLSVTCRFRVTAGRVTGIMGKVRACISDVGDSTLTWQDGAGASSVWSGTPNGRPSGANTIMGQAIYNPTTGYFEATAVYTNLPTSNDGFGGKKIWAQIVEGSQVVAMDIQDIEVFYPRMGFNNPVYAIPTSLDWGTNWFYYWKTGNVCGVTTGWEYDDFYFPMGYIGFYILGDDNVYVTDWVALLGDWPPFTLTHKYTAETITIGGADIGPHFCAQVIAHENLHKKFYDDWAILITQAESDGDDTNDYYDDADDDGIPNGEEATCEGINSDANDPDTYDMEGYIAGYASYGDNEIRCRKKQMNPGLTVDDTQDWSSPGTNSVPPFVP